MAAKIYIVYYSTYGHVEKLAREILKGASSVEGVEVKLWQFKAFFDSTGGLWRAQQLAGKPAGIFYSTASQGGGQETTALTAITQLVHHGMIYVPIGYTAGPGMFEIENVRGGSPYGSGTLAGDGTRQPTELELQLAFHQGKYFAGITKKLKASS